MYVELPSVGANVLAHASCAEVESTKSVSEIYSPVSGTVVEVNEALGDAPELVNGEPYGAGWIFVVEMADPAEVDVAARRRRLPRPRRGLTAPSGAWPWPGPGSSSTTSTTRPTPPARWPPISRCSTRWQPAEPPVLRLYRWDPPALSLGRFQPDDDVDHDACARHGVGVVRRPTGGRALLHGGDVTYAVAFPRPRATPPRVDALYEWLAGGLIAGLALLGVDAAVARNDGPAGPVCFAGQQGADLRVGERKLCGSAQVRRDGAVLQHGSVLIHRLPFDELDLVHVPGRATPRRGGPPAPPRRDGHPRGARRPDRPPDVAQALVEGFAAALDLEFTSRV